MTSAARIGPGGRREIGVVNTQLIELCVLVGHYQMLAMTINALGIEPDPPPTRRPPRMIRLVQGALTRTRDTHKPTAN